MLNKLNTRMQKTEDRIQNTEGAFRLARKAYCCERVWQFQARGKCVRIANRPLLSSVS